MKTNINSNNTGEIIVSSQSDMAKTSLAVSAPAKGCVRCGAMFNPLNLDVMWKTLIPIIAIVAEVIIKSLGDDDKKKG